MKTALVVAAVVVTAFACGGGAASGGGSASGGGTSSAGGGMAAAGGGSAGGGGSSGGGSAAVTCTATANAPAAGTQSGTIVGTGRLSCTGTAQLSIEVCLDYRSTGTTNWNEAMCQSSTKSGMSTLELQTATGCFGSTRDYKLRVKGTVNGAAITEQESAPSKPTCP